MLVFKNVFSYLLAHVIKQNNVSNITLKVPDKISSQLKLTKHRKQESTIQFSVPVY